MGKRVKLALGSVFLWMTACSGLCFAAIPSGLNAAQAAFNRGQADNALRLLDEALRLNAGNAAAWNLQCRIYLAEARWEDAISSCQHAVQIDSGNSQYHLWLGRAYGEKASRASLVTAYQMAKLTRIEFETAVSLDGQNREALSDLGQYYVEAPRFLGGGYGKAETLVARLNGIDPARADSLRARMAEAKKNYAGAEQNWRARIAASQSSPESEAQAWMDLGSFYRRRGQWDQMLAALKSGAAADPNHGPTLVDGASTLMEAGREPELAIQWLREYLNGNALSETAPAFAVHAELGDLLKKQGDMLAANQEFAAAHALSANYSQTAPISTGY
jgi:tetratricopeptide (TPR) repeat protein